MKSTTSAATKTRWAWAIATFFGVGFLKPGPGTWGSIAATALWLLAVRTLPAMLILPLTIGAALLAIGLGIPAATIVERESGGERPGQVVDPQYVVVDEAAGQWIALLAASTPGRATWPHALVCLVLFRLFDITKPPPARQLERLHGGFGIILDDVAAGVYGLIVALVAFHWW